jgi:signal transduction histidine kinase
MKSLNFIGFQKRGLRLSEKLLILTIVFVMLAEILIFLPSIGNFRLNWLSERLSAAQIAALAVEAAPNNEIPETLRQELLDQAEVYSVAVKQNNQRQLILRSPMPAMKVDVYDLRNENFFSLIWDALKVYFQPDNRLISVLGKPAMSEVEFIEVLMVQAPLKKAMISFALNILGLSILISIITAALVYLSINYLLVRPIGMLTENMMHFSENPEDPDRRIAPSGRKDEIGTVENELLSMQTDLSTMLAQKTRLANLGAAISKINHDLRNMLGTAQLVSDRLSNVNDPTVQRVTPRLVRSIDRAIKLCSDTLQYGKPESQAPARKQLKLRPLFEEVLEELGLPHQGLHISLNVDDNTVVYGDHDLLYRVFSNLIRNSSQAIDADCSENPIHLNGEDTAPPLPSVSIKGIPNGSKVVIDIIDTGPGLPEAARAHLFEAFKGSYRKGGTGLGLAIAAEIIAAHKGEIDCLERPKGAHFRIKLPQQSDMA